MKAISTIGAHTATVCFLAATVSAQIPNDPDFPVQWALQNTGQVVENQVGQAGADIHMIDAWQMHSGTRPVVVAVVGRGVDPHVEFADRLLEGTAFAGDTFDSLAVCQGGDTHLVGVIAAGRNNRIGVAGMIDTVLVLPVRIVENCASSPEWMAQGIEWSVDHGADIVLVTLRIPDTSADLESAVAYAAANGVLLIAPAATASGHSVVYPASLEGCLSVAATTNLDTASSESIDSSTVDLSAPGTDVWSTTGTNTYGYLPANRDTTVAAAHVAAAAALLKSYSPGASAAELAQALMNSADDIEKPGWDALTGYGRLNVAGALSLVRSPPLRFDPIDDPPTHVSPDRSTPFVVSVVSVAETLDPGSVMLNYRLGASANVALAHLVNLGNDRFLANLPPVPCGQTVEYSLAAESAAGSFLTDPPDTSIRQWTATSTAMFRVFEDDFEEDLGWTIAGGDATSGRWERDDPVGTSAQPEYDHSPDKGTFCMFTGQHRGGSDGTNDVDGGPVLVTSPVIPIRSVDARIEYARWFQCLATGVPDELTVEVSGDGGQSWTLAETVGSSAEQKWFEHSFRLSDLPGFFGNQIQVRFSTSDLTSDSLTEAAIDDFAVTEIRCTLPFGDVTGDGATGLDDYQRLVGCLTGPEGLIDRGRCAMFDADGLLNVDLSDVQRFLTAFAPN